MRARRGISSLRICPGRVRRCFKRTRPLRASSPLTIRNGSVSFPRKSTACLQLRSNFSLSRRRCLRPSHRLIQRGSPLRSLRVGRLLPQASKLALRQGKPNPSPLRWTNSLGSSRALRSFPPAKRQSSAKSSQASLLRCSRNSFGPKVSRSY